jgi:hypothetical protein
MTIFALLDEEVPRRMQHRRAQRKHGGNEHRTRLGRSPNLGSDVDVA